MTATIEETLEARLYSEDMAQRLRSLGEMHAAAYREAEPYPHIVIDDFLPGDLLEAALEQFPTPGSLDWQKFRNTEEVKLAYSRVETLPPRLRAILHFLNSSIALQFLERLTGIDGLIADPYYEGGGLHQIERGGKLNIHADFNRHSRLRLDRRLNLIIYLNRDWEEEFGGHFEMWDREMTRCRKRVLPVFNRCVVFSTTDYSFHGHPDPLTSPPGRTRKSMALYYYTNGRPEEEASETHSTLFKLRPGEAALNAGGAGETARKVLRALLPPVIVDAYRRLRGRNR